MFALYQSRGPVGRRIERPALGQALLELSKASAKDRCARMPPRQFPEDRAARRMACRLLFAHRESSHLPLFASRSNMLTLPPGPKGAIAQTLATATEPHAYDRRMAALYGDPFTTPTAHGTYVVTGQPELVKAIFTADPDTFDSGSATALSPLVGDDSLLLLTGKPHRRARKLLMPPFHGARMRAYGRLMAETTRRHAALWPTNRAFDVQKTAQAISLEVIVRAVFGIREPGRVAEVSRAIARLTSLFTPWLMFFPALRRSFMGAGPYHRFLTARAEVDRLIHDEIASRRRAGGEGDDILTMLWSARDEGGEALSDSELRDELVTMLFAGHETTTAAIAWAFYWLSQSPAIHARLVSEIRARGPAAEPEALAHLPYLSAVCEETLRLHPIVPAVPRRLVRPLRLGNFELPAGVMVCASAAIAHYRSEVFPEPERFLPERFLGKSPSPFEYFPFGGGNRRCLGAAFALFEMKIVLGTILSQHRVALASPWAIEPERRNVTTGPRGGVKLVRISPAPTQATGARAMVDCS